MLGWVSGRLAWVLGVRAWVDEIFEGVLVMSRVGLGTF